MTGYIKVWRKVFDHILFQGDTFSRRDAWLDLVSQANWTEADFTGTTVPPGTLITSISNLSARWKWSRSKVDRFLTRLQNEHMVSRKPKQRWTEIEIINYSIYQGESEDTETKPKRKRTANRTQTETQTRHNIRRKKKEEEINKQESLFETLNLSAQFKKSLEEWIQFRKEKKKPLSATSIKKLIEKWQSLPGRFKAAVDHSISQNYQGLFEPTSSGSSTSYGGKKQEPPRKSREFMTHEESKEALKKFEELTGQKLL